MMFTTTTDPTGRFHLMSPQPRRRFRDAITGLFTSGSDADARPDQTVSERIEAHVAGAAATPRPQVGAIRHSPREERHLELVEQIARDEIGGLVGVSEERAAAAAARIREKIIEAAA